MCSCWLNKYAFLVNLKDGKGITNTSAFQKTLAESGLKRKQIWVAKGSDFYNR